MRYGVSLLTSVVEKYDVLTELGVITGYGNWMSSTDAPAHCLPLWAEIGTRQLPSENLVSAIRAMKGTEPILYLESSGQSDIYDAILAGEYDGFLKKVAKLGLITRFDQEMNANHFIWHKVGPEKYRKVFRYISLFGIMMYWCPSGNTKKNVASMEAWYPGDIYTDFVGFDKYAVKVPVRSIPRMMRKPISTLRSFTDKPIIIGESAIRSELPGKEEWLSSVTRLEDVFAFIYFDMDPPDSVGIDWTMTPRMRKIYGTIIKAS